MNQQNTINRFKLAAALFVIAICLATGMPARAVNFDLVTPQSKVSIYYDGDECKLNSITANLLADDIALVSGYRPKVSADWNGAKGNVILIGSINSKLMQAQAGVLNAKLIGKWECYGLKVINRLPKGIDQALIIAGSDFRGTAYGVFDLSARIGVTPWYWWADATPVKQPRLSVNIDVYISAEPSVKYRGIFINDEDWGLQPWAAKTFEPETGDIGPKTYKKVFELLLRLKANLIWPAMHPSTKAFYHYPGNIDAAADYQIVVGSSHAEPMLRNNVSEWDEKTMGHFNYLTNQQQVQNYWESRVKESSRMSAIYTMGMRGVHDSGIEGVKTVKETIPLLERIFADQRAMLAKYVNADVTKVPQAFIAYKEVLNVYNAGLKVPDDVTLVWPDDNYGYIQRLNDTREGKRTGGAGVYYHVSYWGRPHDYLWLCTTPPGLIVEEMTKAYRLQARNIWVVNVGDIKPAEYDIQLFLDMAYNVKPFLSGGYGTQHLRKWVADNIDAPHAPAIADALTGYYNLAFERKPEFMAWSRTEPTTQAGLTAYNHFNYNDEAARRLAAYQALQSKVKTLKTMVGASKQDAFYQLVYYPVTGAALMNSKWLYHDKAERYARQGRLSAQGYFDLATKAYNDITTETNYFNNHLSNGKWAGIMSMKPRNLPVFEAPKFIKPQVNINADFLVQPEGIDTAGLENLTLSAFNAGGPPRRFIDLFLTANRLVKFQVIASAPYIKVSQTAVELNGDGLKSEVRLWVSVDWTKAPQNFKEHITIVTAGKKVGVDVSGHRNLPKNFTGFLEDNGVVSIYAKHYQQINNTGHGTLQKISGLGLIDEAMQAGPIAVTDSAVGNMNQDYLKLRPKLSYYIFTQTSAAPKVTVFTLPTFGLNKNLATRYGVSIDDGPVDVAGYQNFDRSEEWKQGVLANSRSITQSIRWSVNDAVLKPGIHKLNVYMIDPGLVVNRIVVDLGGLKPNYGLLPESKLLKN